MPLLYQFCHSNLMIDVIFGEKKHKECVWFFNKRSNFEFMNKRGGYVWISIFNEKVKWREYTYLIIQRKEGYYEYLVMPYIWYYLRLMKI